MGHGYFLMRGLNKVGAEMSLTILSYNLKRESNQHYRSAKDERSSNLKRIKASFSPTRLARGLQPKFTFPAITNPHQPIKSASHTSPQNQFSVLTQSDDLLGGAETECQFRNCNCGLRNRVFHPSSVMSSSISATMSKQPASSTATLIAPSSDFTFRRRVTP